MAMNNYRETCVHEARPASSTGAARQSCRDPLRDPAHNKLGAGKSRVASVGMTEKRRFYFLRSTQRSRTSSLRESGLKA